MRTICLPTIFAALAAGCLFASCSKRPDNDATIDKAHDGTSESVHVERIPVQYLPLLSFDGELPGVLEGLSDGNPVSAIDKQLADYREIRIAVLANVDGEVLPCGCSDGQIGGLVALMPKVRQLAPVMVVSLGDNYAPRSLPEATVGGALPYFADRIQFVRSTIRGDLPLIEVLAGSESRHAPASIPRADAVVQQVVVADLAFELVIARAETWTEIQANRNRESGTPTLMILGGDTVAQRATSLAADHTLWFRSAMNTRHFPLNLSLIARPMSGGRGMVLLTLLVPVVPGKTNKFVAWNEIHTLRAAVSRAATQGESYDSLRARLEQRCLTLLDERPILFHAQQVTITQHDSVDPELYRGYSEFLAARTDHLVVSHREATGSNARCTPCHEEYVTAFEREDKHFRAIEPLRKAGKAGDPFCASCHITPITVEARRASPDKPQFVEGVQCQWCHQSADQHARFPNSIKPSTVTPGLCETCHNENQSPAYVWDQYVRQLSCYMVKKGEGK